MHRVEISAPRTGYWPSLVQAKAQQLGKLLCRLKEMIKPIFAADPFA